MFILPHPPPLNSSAIPPNQLAGELRQVLRIGHLSPVPLVAQAKTSGCCYWRFSDLTASSNVRFAPQAAIRLSIGVQLFACRMTGSDATSAWWLAMLWPSRVLRHPTQGPLCAAHDRTFAGDVGWYETCRIEDARKPILLINIGGREKRSYSQLIPASGNTR